MSKETESIVGQSESLNKRSKYAIPVVTLLCGIAIGVMVAGRPLGTPSTVSKNIQEKIQSGFPETKFVGFAQTEYGLIEAITAKNVYYFDQKAKVAIVGELLDIENKVAVTVERRRHLGKFGDLDKSSKGGSDLDSRQAPAAAAAPSAPRPAAAVKTVDLSELTAENYIVHNEGAGEILYVVSDFNCGFCNKLHQELKGVTDIEVREIPVRFLRDESTLFGAHALCAEDGAAASSDIFEGRRSGITTCDEGVEAVGFNTNWASQNGLTGTPALITEDGRASSGYRELARIRQFLSS